MKMLPCFRLAAGPTALPETESKQCQVQRDCWFWQNTDTQWLSNTLNVFILVEAVCTNTISLCSPSNTIIRLPRILCWTAPFRFMFKNPCTRRGCVMLWTSKAGRLCINLTHIVPRTMFWHEEPCFAYPSHKKEQLDNVYVFVKDIGRDKGQSERKSARG